MMDTLKRAPRRLLTQIAFFILQNPLQKNFLDGSIYQGRLKTMCTPGLNCYSCPAAIASCPVGSMQLFLGGARHSISLFVTGFLLTTGVVFGRFICGYVCPMGLIQDLLFKIKTPKRNALLPRARYIKYAVLALFVLLLPYAVRNELSGLGSPWFCEFLCPSGMIFGALPLLAANDFLRAAAGARFVFKAVVTAGIVLTSVVIYRFFCRVLCPLGAIYSLFNRFAFFKMSCDKAKCVSCGKCREACHIQIDPVNQPNSPECVRCGECVKSCGARALRYRKSI